MHIVVYRPHNSLMCETKSIGPFGTWGEAYDYLCNMPALGQYIPDGLSTILESSLLIGSKFRRSPCQENQNERSDHSHFSPRLLW